MSKVDDNQLQKLGEVLSPEEIQGLLDGTHSVALGRKGRPKGANAIGLFLRDNEPCLVVHRAFAKVIDRLTFVVEGAGRRSVQPFVVNDSYFDATAAPELFAGGPQHGTKQSGVLAVTGSTIDATGVEVRTEMTPQEQTDFAIHWYSQRAR